MGSCKFETFLKVLDFDLIIKLGYLDSQSIAPSPLLLFFSVEAMETYEKEK